MSVDTFMAGRSVNVSVPFTSSRGWSFVMGNASPYTSSDTIVSSGGTTVPNDPFDTYVVDGSLVSSD